LDVEEREREATLEYSYFGSSAAREDVEISTRKNVSEVERL